MDHEHGNKTNSTNVIIIHYTVQVLQTVKY